VWVKSWSELIRECEARLDFVQEKLQIEVSAEEIEDRIALLKASILKFEPEQQFQPPTESKDDSLRPIPSYTDETRI
jgi:uncharacterized small protein (DUF1192 family)